MLYRHLYRATLAAVCIVLTGCGTTMFSTRETNPVLQDFAIRIYGRASTLSTTASRRLALMVYNKDSSGNEVVITCAEPPPDVGETFAKAFAGQLEAAASSKTAIVDSVSLKGGIDSKTATAIAPLLVRSQGLQVLRDSAYTLCVDKMNGWLTDEKYIEMKDKRFEAAMQLITAELQTLPKPAAPLSEPSFPKDRSSPAPETLGTATPLIDKPAKPNAQATSPVLIQGVP